jgi:hypothetical protein
MANLGVILWLIGLSAMTFFVAAWLFDISNRHRHVQKRLDRIFTDAEGGDLSQPLEALTARLDANDERTGRLRDELDELIANLPQSLQAASLLRFQALSDYGGDQSFALVLTSAQGDGVIISSVFAREGTRVYAKPLQGWTSSYSLSFEEEKAIKQAQVQVGEEQTGRENDDGL